MKMLNGTVLSINTWDAPSVACLPQAFSRLSGLVKHDFSFVILWCLLVITSLFFTCLEMVPKISCSTSLSEIKMRLTSL